MIASNFFRSHSDSHLNSLIVLLAGLVFFAFPCCSQSPGRETPQVTTSSPMADSLAKDFKYPFYPSSSLGLDNNTSSQISDTEKINNNISFQRRNIETINQLNSKGQKEGLWVDCTDYGAVNEIYYRNGIESGLYMEFMRTKRLRVLGEYKNGQMCGTWYFFYDTGLLEIVLKDFAKNTYSMISEVDGKKYVYDYKCYSLTYYPNGNKQDEGIRLWSEGDDPLSEFSDEYGTWKYYDDAGRLTNTKFLKYSIMQFKYGK